MIKTLIITPIDGLKQVWSIMCIYKAAEVGEWRWTGRQPLISVSCWNGFLMCQMWSASSAYKLDYIHMFSYSYRPIWCDTLEYKLGKEFSLLLQRIYQVCMATLRSNKKKYVRDFCFRFVFKSTPQPISFLEVWTFLNFCCDCAMTKNQILLGKTKTDLHVNLCFQLVK